MSANRKNVSIVWDHMSKLTPTSVKCNICSHIFKYSGSTSNMKSHLDTKHLLGRVEPLTVIQEDDTTDVKGQTSTSTSASIKPEKTAYKQPQIKNAFQNTTPYHPGSAKKKKLDDLLIGLITEDMQPFSVVEDGGFRKFVQGLDPRYSLPCRKTITSNLLPMKYEEAKRHLMEELQHVDDVAITTDSWTSRQTLSYTTVTAHFLAPLPSWELKSAVLKTIPITEDYNDHSAVSLAAMMTDVFSEFGIQDKVRSIATDNASVMVCCVQKHLKAHHVRCFAHLLNLITKKALEGSESTSKQKIKSLVSYFHSSTVGADKLRSIQRNLGRKERKLIQEVDTRWNSTLAMMRRYVEEADAVEGALSALGKSSKGITDAELISLKSAIQVLSPFELATEQLSTDKRTSYSSMIPTVERMTKCLEAEEDTVLRNALMEGLKVRFKELSQDLTAGAATMLDPRFKTLYFTEQFADKIKEHIMALLNADSNVINESETQCILKPLMDETEPPTKKFKSLWDDHDKTIEILQKNTPKGLSGPELEMERYLGLAMIKRTEDPLVWWKQNSHSFPRLSLVARKYLHIPATSTSSERLFSKAGELISARRSCLKPSVVDKILFLNKYK